MALFIGLLLSSALGYGKRGGGGLLPPRRPTADNPAQDGSQEGRKVPLDNLIVNRDEELSAADVALAASSAEELTVHAG